MTAAVDARTVLVTRMGVGIFDPIWWRSRLGLFNSITAVCDADDGSWSIEQGFRASRWSIELRQFDGDTPVNTLVYPLHIA